MPQFANAKCLEKALTNQIRDGVIKESDKTVFVMTTSGNININMF